MHNTNQAITNAYLAIQRAKGSGFIFPTSLAAPCAIKDVINKKYGALGTLGATIIKDSKGYIAKVNVFKEDGSLIVGINNNGKFSWYSGNPASITLPGNWRAKEDCQSLKLFNNLWRRATAS